MKVQETVVGADAAVQVPSNKFFLVRARQGYAAVMLTEDCLQGDGGDKYLWYFQSDGSGVFTNKRASSGTGEVFENYLKVRSKGGGWDLTDEGGVMHIICGPIKVEWSLGRWVYAESCYGAVEIALTDKSYINEVNYCDKSLIWQKGKQKGENIPYHTQ